MSGWRYIAQRFDGTTGGIGGFLDFNVPLEGVNIEEVLSGHNALTGKITPEYPRLKGPDGKPILVENGTAIWAESPDGEIRGGGILTRSAFNDDAEWEIECTDLTGNAVGLPFDGATYFVNVDPIDVFRYIWYHIQTHRNQNFGMSADTTTSPIRLGTDLIQRQEFDLEPDVSEDLDPAPAAIAPPRYPTNGQWKDAAIKAMKANSWPEKKVDRALTKWLNKDTLVEQKKWEPLTQEERTIRDKSIEKVGWPPNPPNPGRNSIINVVNIRPQMNPPEGGEIIPEPEPDPDTPGPVYEADAFKLNWYETLDLGSTIDELAASTPFDWHLTHSWGEDDEIHHHIRIGYPKLGRRRDDLRFVVGENIHEAPTVDRDGANYANEVMFFGAGEGSAIILGRAFRYNDGRVRKVAVLSDPTVKTQADADRRAAEELAKRADIDDISEIVLVDHPHAPMGAVDLGDEIYIEGDLGWIAIDSWVRVVGRTMSPDDSDAQILQVIRSDRIQ